MHGDSDYFSRSPLVSISDSPTTIDVIFLCISLMCLLHTVCGTSQEWTTPRKLGCLIACCVAVQYAANLVCDLSPYSLVALVVVHDTLGSGFLSPVVKVCDLYLAHERYRVLCAAEISMNGVTEQPSTWRWFFFQCFLVILALLGCFAAWPFWNLLPFFVDTNASPYSDWHKTMGDIEIPCYVAYLLIYVGLSGRKLMIIIDKLTRVEHVESLRAKLWSVGWRAVCHALFSAIGLFLTIERTIHVDVAKVVIILVNVHVFLVWLGWEDSWRLCWSRCVGDHSSTYSLSSEASSSLLTVNSSSESDKDHIDGTL